MYNGSKSLIMNLDVNDSASISMTTKYTVCSPVEAK